MADPEDPIPPTPSETELEPDLAPHWEMSRQSMASDMDDFDAAFETRSGALGDRLWPTISYLLMILAPLTLGLAALPAFLIAYAGDKAADGWLRTHYMFQMRTFWVGVVLFVLLIAALFLEDAVGVAGVLAGVVWALILLVGIAWFVLRMAVGLNTLRRGEPYRDYRTWTI